LRFARLALHAQFTNRAENFRAFGGRPEMRVPPVRAFVEARNAEPEPPKKEAKA